jgi:DNA-binding MarR family transcriptional regulator
LGKTRRIAQQVSAAPDDIRAALDAFRSIVQALRVSSRAIERRLGLTTAQLFALQQLAAAPGASINELAVRTFTHQSSVSVVVQRLVELGLVAKLAAEDDRRRVQLGLTDAGRALLRRSPEPVQQRLIAGIRSLNPSARHELARSLADVARGMGAPVTRPAMLFEDGTRKMRRLRLRRR